MMRMTRWRRWHDATIVVVGGGGVVMMTIPINIIMLLLIHPFEYGGVAFSQRTSISKCVINSNSMDLYALLSIQIRF